MKEVFLGLGSNMGDRAGNLTRAIAALSKHLRIASRSKVYETEPMYMREQPRFYNMAIRGTTELRPQELLTQVQTIEKDMGRDPETHNQPRPIDIDILLYEEHVLDTPELTIPHARMHERAFVLVPLQEIAPFHVHPTLLKPIVDLEDEIGEQSITLTELDIRI